MWGILKDYHKFSNLWDNYKAMIDPLGSIPNLAKNCNDN